MARLAELQLVVLSNETLDLCEEPLVLAGQWLFAEETQRERHDHLPGFLLNEPPQLRVLEEENRHLHR